MSLLRFKRKRRRLVGSNSPRLKHAKGPTRKTDKRHADAHEAAVKQKAHDAVFARDDACRVCGLASGDDQMHENIEPRSATRGRPPEERFNLWNCCRVCPTDHERLTRNEIALVPVVRTLGCATGNLRLRVPPRKIVNAR